jgi:hypothetical protein
MKKILSFLVVVLCTQMVNAQTDSLKVGARPTFDRSLKQLPIQKVQQEKVAQAQPADSLEGETIEHIESVINAIDKKVAYVKSDQTENEKAIATGWYELMARNRAAWVADKEELLRRKNLQK